MAMNDSNRRISAEDKAMLRERELASRWDVSQRTLQRWRAEGFGPAYIYIGGAIRYLMDDVLSFEAARRSSMETEE
jgi:predicted site-specific integrase-resolvase